jgi:hypothetical protein
MVISLCFREVSVDFEISLDATFQNLKEEISKKLKIPSALLILFNSGRVLKDNEVLSQLSGKKPSVILVLNSPNEETLKQLKDAPNNLLVDKMRQEISEQILLQREEDFENRARNIFQEVPLLEVEPKEVEQLPLPTELPEKKTSDDELNWVAYEEILQNMLDRFNLLPNLSQHKTGKVVQESIENHMPLVFTALQNGSSRQIQFFEKILEDYVLQPFSTQFFNVPELEEATNQLLQDIQQKEDLKNQNLPSAEDDTQKKEEYSTKFFQLLQAFVELQNECIENARKNESFSNQQIREKESMKMISEAIETNKQLVESSKSDQDTFRKYSDKVSNIRDNGDKFLQQQQNHLQERNDQLNSEEEQLLEIQKNILIQIAHLKKERNENTSQIAAIGRERARLKAEAEEICAQSNEKQRQFSNLEKDTNSTLECLQVIQQTFTEINASFRQANEQRKEQFFQSMRVFGKKTISLFDEYYRFNAQTSASFKGTLDYFRAKIEEKEKKLLFLREVPSKAEKIQKILENLRQEQDVILAKQESFERKNREANQEIFFPTLNNLFAIVEGLVEGPQRVTSDNYREIQLEIDNEIIQHPHVAISLWELKRESDKIQEEEKRELEKRTEREHRKKVIEKAMKTLEKGFCVPQLECDTLLGNNNN